MIIVTNTTKIKKGEGYKLVNRFDKVGKIESMEGFLGLEVLLTENLQDYDEVTISTRWDSKDSFKNWTKSDAFKEAHAHNGGKPDYIITNKISYYDVKITRNPIVTA
ncbi:heme oxygenase [Pseudogracilibacillus auburnensis]|uniref:Heme-degrading monooxygenase n=1 Tax=Pseudogracilibacillus auburnensis TaxID=1494959 RepID=A0A2V3VVS9_9BACI|nr:heme oxygenase [Pseudogracilibacillus auburnensis]MBO1004050.1 heme oxygenase [Pseudogracilibacillus auburnensis]PXW85660.1 heme oxygenase (staphylobilin-producing) [Pseudogracilibacillus auburnensis]